MAGKHGGKRKGAGRKAKLSLIDCMKIGAECEVAACKLAEQKAWERYEDLSDIQEIRRQQESIRRQQERFVRPIPPSKLTPRAVRKIDEIGRFHSTPITRPKGHRDTIIKTVAKKHKLTARAVRECWRVFRKMSDKMRAS
jgi:hypothetical protein